MKNINTYKKISGLEAATNLQLVGSRPIIGQTRTESIPLRLSETEVNIVSGGPEGEVGHDMNPPD